ncbi:hypothetical protein LUZ60_009898 [Juncus effusus]|nr:hypothetical protein LUZ60_009898 [Juncus effusus]
MVKKRLTRLFSTKEMVDLINKIMHDKPLLPFLIPLFLFAWMIERWLVPFSNWVPLTAAVWATIQYGRFQRLELIEDLNRKWEQLILYTAPVTPIEPCAWTNKLLMEVWPNFLEPKLSRKFFSTVERRLKYKRPKLIEKIELQEFTLGLSPPILGQRGVHWISSNNQKVMRLGFDWDTNDMSVMFLAKLAKPLIGTARIVINSIHIQGDLLLIPILDGQAIVYSFESAPQVRINVAFGGASAQSLPSTELPGVSSWLVKLLQETISKTMVEPRRLCFSLPHIDLHKKATGGILSISVHSASNLTGSSNGSNGSTRLNTVVEVEIGDLMRKTGMSEGLNPVWDCNFNMVVHGETGLIKFNLYELDSSGVKFNYLTGCEIKMKYVADNSTIFWAIGERNSVIAKHLEEIGKEIEMIIPFEDSNTGQLRVGVRVKEWQYADGTTSVNSPLASYSSIPSIQSRTGRKLKVSVLEGRNLSVKDKFSKCDPFVKLHYGKAAYKTKVMSRTTNPHWEETFEIDEISGGEYLKLKCFNSDRFGDESIGSARVSTEGISEGSSREVWVPLEKTESGEVRVRIQLFKNEDGDKGSSSVRYGDRWIELVIIEGRDLVGADLSGTSDPFVRVQYGNTKKRTKVISKTVNPYWNQTLQFADTGSQLSLYVKDHNALLPAVSIGQCTVDYQTLPINQTSDRWVPLDGVKTGQIHIQITRKSKELETSSENKLDTASEAHKVSEQMRGIVRKLKGLVEEGEWESVGMVVSELEGCEDAQEEYMEVLERERNVLVRKIGELGHELLGRSSSAPVNLVPL